MLYTKSQSPVTKQIRRCIEHLDLALTSLGREVQPEDEARMEIARQVEGARTQLLSALEGNQAGFADTAAVANSMLDQAIQAAKSIPGVSPLQMQSLTAVEVASAILLPVVYASDTAGVQSSSQSSGQLEQEETTTSSYTLADLSSKPVQAPSLGGPESGSAEADRMRTQALRDKLIASLVKGKRRRSRPPKGQEAPEGVQRRRSPRVELETKVTFDSTTNFYTGLSDDISAGGLFVSTYDFRPIGTDIDLSFTLPNGHVVRTRGQVRWVHNPVDPDEDSCPGMGIVFQDLLPEDRSLIQEFIQKRTSIFYEE